MTRYVGSRASGYPPDFVPFRPRLGTGRLRCLRWGCGSLPFGSLGRAVRECLEVGRVSLTGIDCSLRNQASSPESSADARDPTTSRTKTRRSADRR